MKNLHILLWSGVFIRSAIHFATQPSIHALIQSFLPIHPSIHYFVFLLFQSAIHLLVCFPTLSFLHPSIHQSIQSLNPPFLWINSQSRRRIEVDAIEWVISSVHPGWHNVTNFSIHPHQQTIPPVDSQTWCGGEEDDEKEEKERMEKKKKTREKNKKIRGKKKKNQKTEIVMNQSMRCEDNKLTHQSPFQSSL